jgi:hypothetical protein
MRIRAAGLLTILLLAAACSADDALTDSSSTAQLGTPAHELKLGEKRWVPLSSPTPAAPRVTSSGDELVLRLGGYFVESATLKGQKYVRVSVPERSVFSDAGMPELPMIRVNVPSSPATAPAMKVVGQTFENVASDPPLPSRGEITRDIDPDTVPYAPSEFYGSGGTFPKNNIELGADFFLRDLHGVPVQFQPFQYDAKAKSLRVYSEIRVRLTGAVDGRQVQRRDAAFESVYESAFSVESTTEADPLPSSYPNVAEPGRLLIITADEYADAVAPLVDWKTRRGLDTTVKRMSEVGTTAAAVQAFIQAEFDSAKSLTYVILVGDANAIPTLKGGRERADCDACYAMVKGGDYYPDLFISRISGRTVGQIETQVAKFVTYERNPDPAGDWYGKAAGIASNEGSPKDWQRTEELRVALEEYGYAPNAKIYDPGAKIEQVTTAVNSGVGLVNYMGHGSGRSWGTTGFSVSDVQALDNTGKWPFIIDVACQNGSFVALEPSFAEIWLRHGDKSSPKGAIGMYAASTNASWVPPTVMQAWAVRELLIKEKRNTVGSLSFGGAARVLETNSASEGQKLVEQYNIFGDASLVLRTKTPKALAVTQEPVNGGTDVTVAWADGSPARGATVAISNGSVVAVAVTDETGIARLTHAVAPQGAAALTVTAYNAIPFEGTVQTNRR